MAQQATVYYLDDVEYDAGREVPADHKGVRFGIDGTHYEIDLSDPNYQKLAEILRPCIRAGRRSKGARTTAALRSAGAIPRTREDKDQHHEIRAWAREQGMRCGAKGRIPANVLEAWAQRHTAGNGHKTAAAHRVVGTNPIWMPPPAEPTAKPSTITTEPPKEGRLFRSKAEMNRAIRAWCRETGHKCNDRGAVPKDVIQVYAHHNGEPRLAE